MAESWLLFEDGARPAAENMAVDEALLGMILPVLRFYSWSEPAASFGYFQRYRDVETMTRLRPLVRRPTGGGWVPHDKDWTYSFILPQDSKWYQLKAVESYRQVHEWIQAGLTRIGLSTELARQSNVSVAGQCFAGAEQFDVLWNARKIAGAAQRRTKTGLLIQGSIQPPVPNRRVDWQRAFCEMMGVRWEPLSVDETLQRRARQLVESKYGRDDYIRRR